MQTITKRVPANEVPRQWRAGLDKSSLVKVTLEALDEAHSVDRAERQRVIKRVAGIWKDRDDISAFYDQLRLADREKLKNTIPKS